ncbi:hypothetical protein F0L74_06305 [Chitinophaga agrisoli]|uniref:Uncharacterized protein n=1 Tax=Chitinophaga agrisoli TaxID=2607653 RepID=A0A5B2W370_9BACT|nr:hypothetical protein [Chitinophaga agrisoli]KAA2245564.1 hypothetical protein F0L74_06305 [Chitinophaga agrisoli]
MTNDLIRLNAYFSTPPGHFWNWSEEEVIPPLTFDIPAPPMEAIEWQQQATICYREELVNILQALAPQGLPPLASILLVMTACGNPSLITVNTLQNLVLPPEGEDRATVVADMALLIRVVQLLQHISQLPAEYRSGSNKTLLLQIIFKDAATLQGQDDLLSMFNSGEYDQAILDSVTTDVTLDTMPAYLRRRLRSHFRTDLEAFEPAIKTYASTEALLQKLRTGVERIPTPAPITLPEPPPSEKDLLTQLAEDENTAGLTRLTQRVMAALKIPMHAQGSSDQSFGGVSDITNRGSFDRLLLSELAYDDELLSARLANNEALYLRREELPSKRNKEWVILVDTTLKMWGLPRVFAMAAALACSRHNKAHASLQAYTLGNKSHQPLDLLSKDGIINGLEKMDTALHSGEALLALLGQQPRSDDRSFFLITDEQTLASPAFQPALASLYQHPGFIITVNRNGGLCCYELVNGRKKPVAYAFFDLDELLFAPPKQSDKTPVTPRVLPAGDWPVLFKEDPFPLRFPTSKVIINQYTVVHLGDRGVLAVTQDQRVLYWDTRKKGAYEVMSFIEEGNYYFGVDQQKARVYLLLYMISKKRLQLYEISLNTLDVSCTSLEQEVTGIRETVFYLNCFFVRTAAGTFSINADNATIRQGEHLSEAVLESVSKRHALGLEVRNRITSFINNGYSVLSSIGGLYVNGAHRLMIGSWVVDAQEDDRIKLRKQPARQTSWPGYMPKITAVRKGATFPAPFNPKVTMETFTWPDGSETIVDSRGLLYLRSADRTIPEICILLILDQFTACWAADGTTCGNTYFILNEAEKHVSGKHFYQHYIQRFIDSLINYAARTTV